MSPDTGSAEGWAPALRLIRDHDRGPADQAADRLDQPESDQPRKDFDDNASRDLLRFASTLGSCNRWYAAHGEGIS